MSWGRIYSHPPRVSISSFPFPVDRYGCPKSLKGEWKTYAHQDPFSSCRTVGIDGSKVTVQKGNKVVAESEGRWEERKEKANANSTLIGSDGAVQEVRFEGDRRVLVLSN